VLLSRQKGRLSFPQASLLHLQIETYPSNRSQQVMSDYPQDIAALLFELVPLGDVSYSDDGTNDLSSSISQGRTTNLENERPPVQSADPYLHRIHPP
jgi:hypothetical protein